MALPFASVLCPCYPPKLVGSTITDLRFRHGGGCDVEMLQLGFRRYSSTRFAPRLPCASICDDYACSCQHNIATAFIIQLNNKWYINQLLLSLTAIINKHSFVLRRIFDEAY